MRNHWSIFSTIQNCEVTELNLKKSFLKRLITTPYFSSSIDSCISSRWISIEFVLITIPRTSSTRYVGTRGVPRISNVTLPILLFPPFQLAGHYTGPDIQSRRISFRNTIKGRKRESRPTVEPTSSVCIDDPVAAAATTTTTTIYACVRVYTRREDGQRSLRCPPLEEKGRREGEEGGELDQTEFSRPLKFSACTTCWRRPRATDDTGRLGDSADCNLIFGDATSLSRLSTIRGVYDCIRDEIKAVDSRFMAIHFFRMGRVLGRGVWVGGGMES